LIIDDNKTINEYLLILKVLKSIFGNIAIIDAINAKIKVQKLVLSDAIKINHIIIGKT
jgi:hypothetical protein